MKIFNTNIINYITKTTPGTITLVTNMNIVTKDILIDKFNPPYTKVKEFKFISKTDALEMATKIDCALDEEVKYVYIDVPYEVLPLPDVYNILTFARKNNVSVILTSKKKVSIYRVYQIVANWLEESTTDDDTEDCEITLYSYIADYINVRKHENKYI